MMIDERKAVCPRHELKHRINPREDLVLSLRLRKLFPHDGNAGADGVYRVTSLYFDDPYDNALREKHNGTDRREKFRLRYYGTDLTFIRLEKKFKKNGLCGKYSERITRAQAEALLAGDYGFLLEGGFLFKEFYSKLQGQALSPAATVCYEREAFVYRPGNVRITIDRNLRAGLSPLHFLFPEKAFIKTDTPFSILEIKYDRFLPELVRAAVQVPGRQTSTCSKYAVCRRFD